MKIRNISPMGASPVLKITAETAEESSTLRHILIALNQGKQIEYTKVVSENGTLKSLDIGIIGESKIKKPTIVERIKMALVILFGKSEGTTI